MQNPFPLVTALSNVMAAKLAKACNPDNSDTLLYVKTENNGEIAYRGFNTVYLAQQLSTMENDFLTCGKCMGISRDTISSGGETLCELCKEENSVYNPAQKVRNSVSILSIKCPLLKDCNWKGKLLEAEEHLKECGSFLIACPLECGDVTKRCKMNNHLTNHCILREVKCEFCNITFISKILTNHLEICPAHPITCKCKKVSRRDEVKAHVDKDCDLTEIECPYAKYSCKIGKILRKDLLAHKKDFYIEHQDMIERENCQGTEELLKVVLQMLEGKCDQLENENNQLQQELKVRKKLLGVTIDLDLKNTSRSTSSEFGNGLYKFNCSISVSGTERKVKLKRLPSVAYSNKNIICITDCVVCLREPITRKPYYINERVCSRMESNDKIRIMTLKDDMISRYQQPNGIVKIEVYFDYDYVTYKVF